jgi:hypothetical protein
MYLLPPVVSFDLEASETQAGELVIMLTGAGQYAGAGQRITASRSAYHRAGQPISDPLEPSEVG